MARIAARGLEASDEAAPVLSGIPLEVVALARLEVEAVRERVAEVTVELRPADGLMVTEAWALETALATMLLSSAETDEAADAADAATDEAEATAEETTEATAEETAAPEPPVKGNWPE